ncbi:ricin-type beta-trefoil lectin domain protein [Actinoplanes sp. NPDC051861]|uniref:ricin-type beta-trefoil lectin domain protein n=1 Tax=Actinoplanes sp. NPDC051861 TaxID=3155170 RepID=UPI0034278DE6
MTAGLLAVALAGLGYAAPAAAEPAAAEPASQTGDYLQPDVPRELDLGLLPAIGDGRFEKAVAPARDGDGRTFVYVEGETAAGAKEAVRAAGGEVLQARGQRVRAAVPGKNLISLAQATGVAAVRQPDRAFPLAVTSEGVEASGAGAWIRAGKTGAGVKVGIVDIGFEGLSDARDAGELPAGVTLHGDDCPTENGSGHGTAVAEIVHDVAPGAELFLACAPDSMTFASAAQWLAGQGVQIINSSIGFPNTGRGDGTGPAGSPAAVVQQLRSAGVLWVGGAGNQAHLHWTGPAADADADGYVEVNGAAEGNGFTVPAGGTATVSLKWDAWPATRQDLDLMVLSANRQPTGPSDTAIVAQSTNPQATATEALPPTEQVTIENTSGGSQTYWIYTAARAPYPGTRADVFVMGDATSLSYPVAAGSILEPASSPYVMAVGASLIGSGRVDDYSAQGPTVDGRTKPDITGQSGVSTYTFGPAPTMAGTSAAAAHVAGAAALLKGASSGLGANQIQALLEERTNPAKFDNQWGHGLLALGTPDLTEAPATSGYTPLQLPRRLIDTSTPTGGHQRAFTAGEVFTLPISDLPGDVTAVAVNLTGWSADRTNLSLYRDVDSDSGNPTLEVEPNGKRTTMAIVPVSAARTIAIRNNAGSANLNIDLLGYFSRAGAGNYTPKDSPQRILDTRTTTGGHNAPFAAAEAFTLPVRGVAGVPENATAVLVNLTAAENSAATFLGVYPQTQPSVLATLETPANSQRSNLALTGIGDDGAIRIRNQYGRTAVTVDLLGWFAAGTGARYVPLTRAAKILDTRSGTGVPVGAVGHEGIASLSVSDVAGVPRDVTAPVLSVAGSADGTGGLSFSPPERGFSGTVDLRGLQSQLTVSGLTVPRSGPTGKIRIRNTAGATHVTAAVTGYFTGGPALAEQTGSCAIDAEPGFTPLFDGRTRTGGEWRAAGTGSTVDSANCETTSAPNNTFRWYAPENLPSEYTLRLDYKADTDTADSGVVLGFSAPTDGGVPTTGGYEVQIKPNGAGGTVTGSINDQRAAVALAEKPAGQWNAMDVKVSGKRITVRLNEVVVNDFVGTSATSLLNPSFIGLQGSPAGAAVRFRNVRVRVDQAAARYGAVTVGGQCVDVVNAARATGTLLQAIACRGNDAQQFTLPGDGTLRIFGRCVDVGGPVRSGTWRNVYTWNCNGTASQQWVARADGSLHNPHLDTCLDAPSSGTLNLYTFTCTGNSNQQWVLPAGRARFGPLTANGYDKLCMDVYNQSAVVGAQLQVYACQPDAGNQQFTLPGDGTVRIYGYCVDQNGPVRINVQKWLQLSACNGSASQQWALRSGEQLYNPAVDGCVDYPVDAAVRLTSGSCHGGANQRFSAPALGQDGTLGEPPSATLVGSWAMQENSGTTTADGTGRGRTATLSGATWTTGHTGAGTAYSGSAASSASAPATALQTDRSYSISVWAKASSATGYRSMVAQEAGTRSPFTLLAYPASTEWQFGVTPTGTSTDYTRARSGTGTLVVDRWTHLTAVHDAQAGKIRLYVDGVLKSTTVVPKLWAAPGPTVFGRNWWNSAAVDHYAGVIDDVRIYQGVLTASEITALSRS